MNQLASNCNACGADIMVNQKEWHSADAHVCSLCYNTIAAIAINSHHNSKSYGGSGWKDTTEDKTEDWNVSIGAGSYPRCECGAEKAGTPWHATWCDMYEDPMNPRQEIEITDEEEII